MNDTEHTDFDVVSEDDLDDPSTGPRHSNFPIKVSRYFEDKVWGGSDALRDQVIIPEIIYNGITQQGNYYHFGRMHFLPDIDSKWTLYSVGTLHDTILRTVTYTRDTWSSLEELSKATIVNGSGVFVFTDTGKIYPNEHCYLMKYRDGRIVLAIKHVTLRYSNFELINDKVFIESRPLRPAVTNEKLTYNFATVAGQVKPLWDDSLSVIDGVPVLYQMGSPVASGAADSSLLIRPAVAKDITVQMANRSATPLVGIRTTTLENTSGMAVDYYLIPNPSAVKSDRRIGQLRNVNCPMVFLRSIGSSGINEFYIGRIMDDDFIQLDNDTLCIKVSRIEKLLKAIDDEVANNRPGAPINGIRSTHLTLDVLRYREQVTESLGDIAHRWALQALPERERLDILSNAHKGVSFWNPVKLQQDTWHKAVTSSHAQLTAELRTSNYLDILGYNKVMEVSAPHGMDDYFSWMHLGTADLHVTGTITKEPGVMYEYYRSIGKDYMPLGDDLKTPIVLSPIGDTLTSTEVGIYARPIDEIFLLADKVPYTSVISTQPHGEADYDIIFVSTSKRSLIENIDYFRVKGSVVITRTSNDINETITVRVTGVAPISGSRHRKESGYIEHGVVGFTDGWFPRIGSNMVTVVGGESILKTTCDYYEIGHSEVQPEFDPISKYNGSAYGYMYTGFRPLREDVLTLSVGGLATLHKAFTDEQKTIIELTDYMKQNYKPVLPAKSSIFQKQIRLCSPFLLAVLNDVVKNGIAFTNHELNDLALLKKKLAVHLWLLDCDPASSVNDKTIDRNICTIRVNVTPDVLSVSPSEYSVLVAVNNNLLSGRVDLRYGIAIK